MKKLILCLVLLAGAGGAAYAFWYGGGPQPVTFKTVAAGRGSLVATISATGTLEPENVIDVGAQVSGMIERLGPDPNDSTRTVDFKTQVDVGTVLAELDPSLYQARVNQAQANLNQARANLEQLKAAANQTSRDWDRAQEMMARKAVAGSDYDLAQAAYEKARAQLEVGKAAIKTNEAALQEAQTNLRYCTIVSKARGVIIDRRVNVGQTVVSGLQAPSLFLIATDLSHMQVWASVNEADVGQIKPGQLVRFTVDAFPGRGFEGRVNKIRLNASMTQNVVTYTVEVNVDNARYGNILLPYMTANLQFVIDEKPAVLQVPNTALRWKPRPEQLAPDARTAYAQALRRKEVKLGANGQPAKPAAEHRDAGRVWVQDGAFVRPVAVKVGLTDGTVTEIVSGLKEGDKVVIGEEHKDAEGGTSNPFAPKLFGGKQQ